MNWETIAPFAPYICSFLTGILSFIAARLDARKEIKKLKLEWDHQRTTQSEQEFENMIRLANAQFSKPFSVDSNAITAVGIVRSKASGTYAESLDDLLRALSSGQSARIPPAIQRVLEEKSKLNDSR